MNMATYPVVRAAVWSGELFCATVISVAVPVYCVPECRMLAPTASQPGKQCDSRNKEPSPPDSSKMCPEAHRHAPDPDLERAVGFRIQPFPPKLSSPC